MVRALRHPWASNRMWAAFILGEMRDKQAIKPLVDILDQLRDTKDLLFPKEIAIGLGKIDGEEAVPPLVRLMDHPSFLVREATAAIKKALDDPNPVVQELAKKLEKNSQ